MTPGPGFFYDIHTHGRTGPRMLTSVSPGEPMTAEQGAGWYSVGIHPWDTATTPTESDYDRLARLAADPRVAAIGETGLDALRGAPASVQEEVFRRHVELSERLGKFLIIHCVRRYGRIMELKRELRPSQPWIIHGFRGKPELARQLVAAGFGISLGVDAPAGLREALPEVRFYAETDMRTNP